MRTLWMWLVGGPMLAAVYQVDCADARFRAIEPVNAIRLGPGDKLLLKAGCRWKGTLRPNGSGEPGRPIVVSRHGEGPAPAIDGDGAEAAVLLEDQEHIELIDLEVTNNAETAGLRRGVLVRNNNSGRTLRHIRIAGLFVHHVTGRIGADMTSKCTGGIGFEAFAKQRPSRFDDIVIERNRIQAVDAMAIYLNTDVSPHPRDPQWDQLRHTRVVARNNRIEDTGKNAICLRASLGPLIDGNTIRGAAARYHGNAIYVFGCKNALIQRNEVSGTKWHGLEGAAFDSDYNSEGTVIQYNHSHENGGGLANLCNNPASKPPRGYNDGTVVRYNLSRNESARVIGFDGPVTNTQIYNNTILVGPGLSPNIVEFDTFGKGPGWADRTVFQNNIIVNQGAGRYAWGKATSYSFEANCFAGNHPESEPADPRKVAADPVFEAGTYRLAATSPCAGNGARIDNAGVRDYAESPLRPGAPDRGAFQTPNFRVADGIVWRTVSGEQLKADLYIPQGAGPFPVVLYLHGGGWSSGSKNQLRRQAAYLASRGIAGVATEYRLAPRFRFPAQLEDAREALGWIGANAARYGFDSKRVAAAGSSAGGHLALLLALADSSADGRESRLRAVAALNPAIDLTDMTHRASLVSRLLGGPCAERLELCKAASPLRHAGHRVDTEILVLHGTADETIPYRHAVTLVDRLKAAGTRAELWTADDGPHTFWSLPQWHEPAMVRVSDFLSRQLNGTD